MIRGSSSDSLINPIKPVVSSLWLTECRRETGREWGNRSAPDGVCQRPYKVIKHSLTTHSRVHVSPKCQRAVIEAVYPSETSASVRPTTFFFSFLVPSLECVLALFCIEKLKANTQVHNYDCPEETTNDVCKY